MDKIELSRFIDVPIMMPEKGEDGKRIFSKAKASLNPASVCAYQQYIFDEDGKHYDITIVCCGGNNYWVDLPYDEFTDFWKDVDRSFEIKDDKL